MARPDQPEAPGDETLPKHGGDLSFARRRYGEPASGWLDLSTGINPVPFPAPLAVDALFRLPDRGALSDLLAAARVAYGLPARAEIAAVPGSDAALRALPVAAPAGTIAIVAPTYPGHADAWLAAGRHVVTAASVDTIPADAVVAVLGNPNNPDGRIVDRDRLVNSAKQVSERGGFLVVDEAFADVEPTASLTQVLDDGVPAVVLRSIGKFYGLPGLRLGFVAGDAAVVDRLESQFGAWPVSGPAISVGTAALTDDAWREATRARLRYDMDRLHEIVARYGLNTVGGTDLFLLIDDGEAGTIHRRLAERGIWTRQFIYQPRWLRLGLPPEDGFARLDRALAEIL